MAYFFFNATEIIGTIIQGATNNATGSLFLTISLIVIGFFLIGMMFRLSFEVIIILILPVVLVATAFLGEFWAMAGIFLVFLGILFAKIFFFNK